MANAELLVRRVTTPAADPSRVQWTPTTWAVVVALALIVPYTVVWIPAGDLPAQVARANALGDGHGLLWWTGWFGGITQPTYSMTSPWLMSHIGVRPAGALAVLAGSVAGAWLARDTLRPRTCAVAFVLVQVGSLLIGRVTFAIGIALAAWALVAVRRNWHAAAGVALAIATFLASPLAGLFLGLLLVAVAVADANRRRATLAMAAALLVTAGGVALLFPGAGEHPFTLWGAVPAAACCVAVAVLCPNRTLRIAVVVILVASVVLLIEPLAIGRNITRLAWVAAVPVVIACAPLARRHLVPAVALLAIWPTADVAGQMVATRHPSAAASFYQPLREALLVETAAAGPLALGARVEMLETELHWSSAYLGPEVAIARGWERQADRAENPLFYEPGLLTAASYHAWLHDLAVGWVAVPNAPLDYASRAEHELIATGLPYLNLVWSSPDWKLYRVTDAALLAAGAKVVAVDSGGVVLQTDSATVATVRLRYSPYLVLRDATTEKDVPSCIRNVNGWTQVTLPHAGEYRLTGRFTVTARLGHSECEPATR